jgi:hypothetical protein
MYNIVLSVPKVENEILQPQIGSVLLRKNNKSSVINAFVVTKIINNHSSKPKNLILEPVISIENGIVTYNKSDFPLILSLNTHHRWWSNAMLKTHSYFFVTDLQFNFIAESNTSLEVSRSF